MSVPSHMRLARKLSLLAVLSLLEAGSCDSLLAEGASPHWSFQRVLDPRIPSVRNERWPRNDVDRFILERLEEAGLSPSLAADKRTLIRRATFDLTGLPPTPAETDAFLAD